MMTPDPTVKFLAEFFFTDVTHWLGLVVLCAVIVAPIVDSAISRSRR